MRRFREKRHFLDDDEDTRRYHLAKLRSNIGYLLAGISIYLGLREMAIVPAILDTGFLGFWLLLFPLPLGWAAGYLLGWNDNRRAAAVSGAIAALLQALACLILREYYWTEQGEIIVIIAMVVAPLIIALGCYYFILWRISSRA